MADQGRLDRNTGPISKRLISFEYTPTEQIQLIEQMLRNVDEQRAARDLDPTDASTFIEFLDSVLGEDILDALVRPTCVRYLARVCGWHKILPKSALISDYDRGSVVTEGGYSEIWKGSHSGRTVAVKVLMVYGAYDDAQKRELTKAIIKEAITWKNTNHPNIIPFVGAKMVTDENESYQFELISEFMENGTINTYISRNLGVNRLELLKDVAAGLMYLHSQKVVHGDLKGQNILINNHGRACLADFGLSRVIQGFTSSSLDMSKSRGTLGWMSPEVYSPEEYGSNGDARPKRESDVYSLGVVIYEVICGHRLFHELSADAAQEKLLDGKFPPRPAAGFTDSLWRTVESCCRVQHSERPKLDDVFENLDKASRAR